MKLSIFVMFVQVLAENLGGGYTPGGGVGGRLYGRNQARGVKEDN